VNYGYCLPLHAALYSPSVFNRSVHVNWRRRTGKLAGCTLLAFGTERLTNSLSFVHITPLWCPNTRHGHLLQLYVLHVPDKQKWSWHWLVMSRLCMGEITVQDDHEWIWRV